MVYHRRERQLLTARAVVGLPHNTGKACDTHKIIIMESVRDFNAFV